MAKMTTPAMERINKRRAKSNGKLARSTPGRDAWRRLIRNRTAILGMIIIIVLLVMALFAPLIAPYAYDEMDVMHMLEGPSSIHWFGTDELGRDMLSRCIYGARITLPIAIFTVIVAILLGGTLGTLRGAIFTVVDSDYVESSKSMGASSFNIMFKHLLPNAVGPVILAIVGLLGVEVLCVSTLSFLGVGVKPPTPEWGSLLSTSKGYLNSAPYLCAFPGLFIMLAVLGFNLLGDGLRDALDPRLK